MVKNKIRTRFAPSPTGSLHIGGLRTALYSYALAKHNGGDFILRIEDTDQKREVKGAREEIEKHLQDFGLAWDEHYVQSERKEKDIYKKMADKLVEEGHAFYCDCKAKNAKAEGYSKELRDPCRNKNLSSGAVKLKTPDDEIVQFVDYVLRKKISWKGIDVADATLLKTDGFPTYHLAVVVDDHEMNITHALRGYDWLPSTPIHLLVYKYLGFQPPEIGHLTDILDPEGGKLSKRKGSISVNEFLSIGYLHEALLNFVMLLGWAPKDNREFFTLDELVENFNPDGFQRSNPIFNRDKLLWFNGEYIRKLKVQDLKLKVYEHFDKKYSLEQIEEILPLIQSRIATLADFENIAGFLFVAPNINKKILGKNYKKHLSVALEVLNDVAYWEIKALNDGLIAAIAKNDFKTGDFFMDLRIALSGQKITPPISESMIILGKTETLARIKKVI